MTKIVLHGASGRMGMTVAKLINQLNNKTLVGGIDSKTTPGDFSKLIGEADLLIDFSLASAIDQLFVHLENSPTASMICTTDLSNSQMEKMQQLSDKMPILYAPNTSVGASLLAKIASQVGKILADYDAEIIDIHHRHKKDAPSGTAITIAQSIAKGRGVSYEDSRLYGRAGTTARRSGEIAISSLRSGGVFGEHHVSFGGENEVFCISHQALSRDLFAEGALRAGDWLKGQKSGQLYSMTDIFEI